MENQIKTLCILIGFSALAAGCATVSAPPKAEAPPVPQMYLSVGQAPQIGFVFCETDTCPKPTLKTLPAVKSTANPAPVSAKSPSYTANGSMREAVLEIAFPFNKATITEGDRALLQRNLKEINPAAIRIVGRSDFVGPAPAQTKLAIDRAEVLRAALSSPSSSPQITVETEVAAPNPVNASLQAHQRRGSVFFVR